jgi:G3E family GTPase
VLTPVTVLTGFLGSGKTTLLNRLVRTEALGDCAVVINEVGAVPVDHLLVREARDDVVVLPNGCICCSVANELTATLRDLYFRRASGALPAFRRVLIETTGLADPAPILYSLVQLPLVAVRYALSGVVTVVDGEHGMWQLDQHVEAVRQVAMADRLVLSKADRTSGSERAALARRLAALNPAAPVFSPGEAVAEVAQLIDAGLHRLDQRPPDVARWLAASAYRPAHDASRLFADAQPASRHDARIAAFVAEISAPVVWAALEEALELLLELHGPRILRIKGLVWLADDPRPTVLHAVQHTLYPPGRLDTWPYATPRTEIVFITQDLPPSAVLDALKAFIDTPISSALPATRPMPH